jgi:hypothetical protein
MILQNHKQLPVSIFSFKIAALGSLKRVTGRNLKISKFSAVDLLYLDATVAKNRLTVQCTHKKLADFSYIFIRVLTQLGGFLAQLPPHK